MDTYAKIGFLLKFGRLARQLSTGFSKRPNFYELLGVSPKATIAEIKNAYFEKTKLYHPDVVGPSEENLALFRQVSEAYEVLGSPALRRDYDENVLGLSREELKDSEDDPITAYKNKMSNEKMYSWTKEHYSRLRKEQYVYRSYPFNPSQEKSEKEESNYILPMVTIIISFGILLINHYKLNTGDKVIKTKII